MKTTFRQLIVAVAILACGFAPYVSAQVMQSTSYRIQSDSINVGGVFSTSSSYRLEDTTGEVATGLGTSTTYNLSAGYQSMQEVYLSLSSIADVTLTPAIGGVSGGTSNGSTTMTATTDNPAGYQLTIQASSSPAMQQDGGSSNIDDYAPSGADPDFSFTTDVTESHLAFSPEGTDIDSRYKDNGSSCNTGSGDTALACWDGLSTTPRTIVNRTSPNHPSGTETTIRFRVGIGSSVIQPEGTYIATTTVTLLPL
jgi:hypothetical protein